jgi:hypothetical protein
VWFEKKNGIIYGSSSAGGSMPVIKRRSSAGKQHAGSRRKAMYRCGRRPWGFVDNASDENNENTRRKATVVPIKIEYV